MGPLTQQLIDKCRTLGRRYVGYRGQPQAPLWFIGEAPGADEDQCGVPFVGSSGRELDRMLSEAGISLSDCCFSNSYKVRPPDNDIERIEETGITHTESRAQLLEELHEYKPRFIVPLGGTALQILCGFTIDSRDKESKISKWRGSILTSEELRWPHYVIPNFHPAYILREWSDRDVAVFIFRRIAEEWDYLKRNRRHQPLPQRELIPNPSFGEAEGYLLECLNHDGPTSCDFELLARKVPICLGFSYRRDSACSISLLDGDGYNLARLWRLIDKVLRKKRIVGQNWSTFDSNWAESIGFASGIPLLEDTLVRHHVLHPELSHKLDFQVMQYTREPYFKDEGKGWTLREGMTKLKRYNCLDACTTLEVYEEQEKEFDDNPRLRQFYREYEMPLARAFHSIDKRGWLTDTVELDSFRGDVTKELTDRCVAISNHVGNRPVVFSQDDAKQLAVKLSIPVDSVLNISSVPQLKEVLKNELKIKLKSTYDHKTKTSKESTGEDSLNEAFAATGNPVLKDILRVRELNKLLGTYINARLNNRVFYTNYSVTGTVTGRRASRKNFLGLGSNGQNQPKHSDLGERFQGVFIARPGYIIITCDQASAEEWIVQGIIADVSGDTKGIRELQQSITSGISRHAVLASQIFSLPIEKTNNKECLEYYVGKKVRHAGNYDMREDKMASVMASEGFPAKKDFCAAILSKFHEVEPTIRGVFHKHIQDELCSKKMLRTPEPFGRERTFHGLRPYGDNSKVFREGYAYIPQSCIGDNNGQAILVVERGWPGIYLADGHDASYVEVPNTFNDVLRAMRLLEHAYDRVIRFPRGFEVRIPIDFKLGFSMKGLKKCPGPSGETGLLSIYETLNRQQRAQNVTTSGVLSHA